MAGGYNEGRFTMFYPFNTIYVNGGLTADRQNILLGTSEGWIASGWLPDDRKVRTWSAPFKMSGIYKHNHTRSL